MKYIKSSAAGFSSSPNCCLAVQIVVALRISGIHSNSHWELSSMMKNKLYRYGDPNGLVPAHLHFGQEAITRMLKNKDIVALINSGTGEKMTYLEMAQRAVDVAVSLKRIGVKKGDMVGVCSEKRMEVLPSILGIICAGATYAPADWTYGSFPFLLRLNIPRPKVIFCSETAFRTHKATFEEAGYIEHYIFYDEIPNGAQNLQPLKSGIKPDAVQYRDFLETAVLDDFSPAPVEGWKDDMLILFSSGTTGMSKGIPVTHLSFLLNFQSFVLESYKGKCILNTREWYNTYGLMYTLSCVMVGATIVFSPTNKEADLLDAVQKYKVLLIQMTPSTIMDLVKSSNLRDYDVSSLQYILSASTPVNSEMMAVIKQGLPNIEIIQLYGMSEVGCICTELSAPKGSKAGSSGVPSLGLVLKYHGNVFPECKDDDGFLKTGDVGYYDDDGYFFIIDRIKELIKFHDIAIAPAEFEALLHQHPAVREAGVVGAKHPEHGEAPVAFVALQPGATATEKELVEYVDSRVTYRMRLAGGVRFVDKLPRGAGEKLDRKALLRMLDE